MKNEDSIEDIIMEQSESGTEQVITQTNQSSSSVSDEKAEKEVSEKYDVQEAIESSRKDTLNTFSKIKQQPTDYNTEEYKKFLNTLIMEKNVTGQFNEAKFLGPLFWKNSLIKAGLIEEAIHPKQFEGRLKPIECTSCGTFFARLPTSEVNILPSKLPCSKCFDMKNESTLLHHQLEKHRELPPFICKECLWKSETWNEYIQHMKNHFKYIAKCSECVYSDMMNKSANTILFLCHVCDMSFDSDDKLKAHVEIHLEN